MRNDLGGERENRFYLTNAVVAAKVACIGQKAVADVKYQVSKSVLKKQTPVS